MIRKVEWNCLSRSVLLTAVCVQLGFTGCYTAGSDFADQLNPYADSSTGELGQRNTGALGGGGRAKEAEAARHALEVMGSHQRASAPQPYYPVVRPAEIRLMWIPDHVNRLGDLVPAHYYYLRVLGEEFAVQDAFETERILNSKGPVGYSGAPAAATPSAAPAVDSSIDGNSTTPWQYKTK